VKLLFRRLKTTTPSSAAIERLFQTIADFASWKKSPKWQMLQMARATACFCALTTAFSALTVLVGWQEGLPACKNWVVRYWRGYLSGVRCKWFFAYGPADTTATPLSLAPVKSWMVYFSGAGLPRLSWKKGCWTDEVVVVPIAPATWGQWTLGLKFGDDGDRLLWILTTLHLLTYVGT